MHAFLLTLEGMFRTLPKDTPRENTKLLIALQEEILKAVDEATYYQKARQAAAAACSELPRRRQRCSPGVAATEGDFHEAPDGVDSDAAWPLHTARTIMNLKKTLVHDITETSSPSFLT